jgi:pilus assembly protein Flp/PilA
VRRRDDSPQESVTRRSAGTLALGVDRFTDRQVQEKEKSMRRFGQWLSEFVTREDGPTAVEYAVMLALIIVVCIAAITTLGQNADNTFLTVGNAIGSAGS